MRMTLAEEKAAGIVRIDFAEFCPESQPWWLPRQTDQMIGLLREQDGIAEVSHLPNIGRSNPHYEILRIRPRNPTDEGFEAMLRQLIKRLTETIIAS